MDIFIKELRSYDKEYPINYRVHVMSDRTKEYSIVCNEKRIRLSENELKKYLRKWWQPSCKDDYVWWNNFLSC